MKKILWGFAFLVMGVLLSCEKADVLPVTALPAAANAFLAQYAEGVQVLRVEREGQTFSVALANGLSIDFDAQGDWQEVDGPDGLAIPTGFILNPILDYVQLHHPTTGINSIEKTASGFEVDLVQGDVELLFAATGAFISMQR